jgi:hypothetical protein
MVNDIAATAIAIIKLQAPPAMQSIALPPACMQTTHIDPDAQEGFQSICHVVVINYVLKNVAQSGCSVCEEMAETGTLFICISHGLDCHC